MRTARPKVGEECSIRKIGRSLRNPQTIKGAVKPSAVCQDANVWNERSVSASANVRGSSAGPTPKHRRNCPGRLQSPPTVHSSSLSSKSSSSQRIFVNLSVVYVVDKTDPCGGTSLGLSSSETRIWVSRKPK